MGRRVLEQLALGVARADHLAAQRDDRADGHVAVLEGGPCVLQGQAHELVVGEHAT